MPVKLDLQNDDGIAGLPAESSFVTWIEAALQRDFAAVAWEEVTPRRFRGRVEVKDLAGGTLVKDLVTRLPLADFSIDNPGIEDIVRAMYVEGKTH